MNRTSGVEFQDPFNLFSFNWISWELTMHHHDDETFLHDLFFENPNGYLQHQVESFYNIMGVKRKISAIFIVQFESFFWPFPAGLSWVPFVVDEWSSPRKLCFLCLFFFLGPHEDKTRTWGHRRKKLLKFTFHTRKIKKKCGREKWLHKKKDKLWPSCMKLENSCKIF